MSILFLYNNLADTAILTASSEAVGFAATNVQNPFRTKVWRTAGVTPGTANLVINHGSPKSVTCVALTGYNWASAPGTFVLQFNDADAWGAPAVTETLTWSVSPTANGNKAVIVKTFTSHLYQYNRLNVVYATGDWDLGRIFLGTYFQPTKSYSPGWTQEMSDDSVKLRTIGGQGHIDEIEQYRKVNFGAVIATQAQWESYQTMFNSVGMRKDLFIAFDYTNEANEMTIYGKFANLPGMTQYASSAFKINVGFEESR